VQAWRFFQPFEALAQGALSDGFDPVSPAAILPSVPAMPYPLSASPCPAAAAKAAREAWKWPIPYLARKLHCYSASRNNGGNMKELQKDKFKVLAEVYGWSPDYAKGFVDGEISRLRGKKPSEHARIGIDEYCLGFRAGYFERQNLAAIEERPGQSSARRGARRGRDAVEPVDVTTGPKQSGEAASRQFVELRASHSVAVLSPLAPSPCRPPRQA
jgi:hypothetical protein